MIMHQPLFAINPYLQQHPTKLANFDHHCCSIDALQRKRDSSTAKLAVIELEHKDAAWHQRSYCAPCGDKSRIQSRLHYDTKQTKEKKSSI